MSEFKFMTDQQGANACISRMEEAFAALNTQPRDWKYIAAILGAAYVTSDGMRIGEKNRVATEFKACPECGTLLARS